MRTLGRVQKQNKSSITIVFIWLLALVLPIAPVFSANSRNGDIRGDRAVVTRVNDNREEKRFIEGVTEKPTPAGQTSPQNTTSKENTQNDLPEKPLPEALVVENEIIVQFEDWATKELIDGTLSNLGATTLDNTSRMTQVIGVGNHTPKAERAEREIRFSTRADATHEFNAVIQQLNNLPYVAYAEPNFQVEALGVPNDPYYSYQWNLHHIKASDAWDHTQGKGVTVAIIDTGVAYANSGIKRQAPELSHVTFVKPYNVLDNTTSALDDNGHGTHIAGVIAAGTNNNSGISGIASLVSIMPVKALDSRGYGTYANIAKAIHHAVDNGADIINVSLGGTTHSEVLKEAVEYAYNHNVLVIAAGGNDGSTSLRYPAAYDRETISVGSSDIHKQRADYSNTSPSLDLLAPGGITANDDNNDTHPDAILSQTYKRTYFFVNTAQFGYFYYQGTSVSAPHVAAVAALVKSAGITNAQDIEAILLESAEDLGSSGHDSQNGHGLVRADVAVMQALGNTPEPTETPQEESESEQTEETNESSEGASSEETQEEESTEEETPNQEPEKPATEESDASENNEPEESGLPKIEIVADTYNLWRQIDNNFVFWETAFLGIQALVDGVPLSRAETNVQVFNEDGRLVARGAGRTDRTGEIWLALGRHNQGKYSVVIDVVKNGFESAREELEFQFK